MQGVQGWVSVGSLTQIGDHALAEPCFGKYIREAKIA